MKRLLHNIGLFGVGFIILGGVVWTYFSSQTASLTDVLSQEQTADMRWYNKNDQFILSSLKEFSNVSGSILSLNLFSQDNIEQSIQSSYGFFVTDNNNGVTINIYLPLELQKDEIIITIDNDEIILDSVLLFMENDINELIITRENETLGLTHP